MTGVQTCALPICRPSVLILDDSASALDYATDAALRKALRALSEPPITFIVSQRTSSVRFADRILVLDDGVCVGQGTHEELLSSCPVYREIHEAQQEDPIREQTVPAAPAVPEGGDPA